MTLMNAVGRVCRREENIVLTCGGPAAREAGIRLGISSKGRGPSDQGRILPGMFDGWDQCG